MIRAFKLSKVHKAYVVHGMAYGFNLQHNADDFDKIKQLLSRHSTGIKNKVNQRIQVNWTYTKHYDGGGMIYVNNDLLGWLALSLNFSVIGY